MRMSAFAERVQLRVTGVVLEGESSIADVAMDAKTHAEFNNTPVLAGAPVVCDSKWEIRKVVIRYWPSPQSTAVSTIQITDRNGV